MTIQTLVVTTDQKDTSLIEKMNLQTDAVIGNQCKSDEVLNYKYKNHNIQYINHSTRGVGINRNTIMMRADADICICADDDMTFLDGYADHTGYWFEQLPDADILIFNLQSDQKKRKEFQKIEQINKWNFGKYGAARLAFRTNSVKFSGVMFHTMFGGGARYSCGEDVLFLKECLEKGLKIYGVPETLARISDDKSSWFDGYTDKYFFDRGILYYVMNPRTCLLHSMYHCVRYRKKYKQYGAYKAYRQMRKAIKNIKG